MMVSRIAAWIAFAALAAATASAQLSYDVTNGADSGPGSLRQAILDTNALGPCPRGARYWISFPQRPSADVPPLKIQLQSPLPPLTNTSCAVEIGFRAAAEGRFFPAVEISGPGNGLHIHYAASVRLGGIALSGFDGHGVVVEGSHDVRLQSMSVAENGKNGVLVVDSRSVSLQSVVSSGNGGNGLYTTRSSDLELIDSRFLANYANGVHLHDANASATDSYIRGNALTGLLVTGDSSPIITRGGFVENGLLGIDIGGDGPDPENVPTIESATFSRGWTRIAGRVWTTPNTRVTVTIYVSNEPDPSGFGEGAAAVGRAEVTSDDSGNAAFVVPIEERSTQSVRNGWVSAVATTANGTSEFSKTVAVIDREPRFVVTTTRDSGPGSLRQAISDLNTSDECAGFDCIITFAIDEATASGVHTIAPATALPVITANRVLIEGHTQGMFGGDTNPAGPEIEISGHACDGCNGLEIRHEHAPAPAHFSMTAVAINGFARDGIAIVGPAIPQQFLNAGIIASYIGTDATGSAARPNGRGVSAQNASVTIDRSIVSGNQGDGVVVAGGTASLSWNQIGTDRSGLVPLGNGANGILTSAGRSWIIGNLVAFNGDRGIAILEPEPALAFNIVHSNGSLGIDIGGDGVTSSGTAGIVDVPVITSAYASGNETTITFRASRPADPFLVPRVELFAASFTDATGYGEGRTRLDHIFLPVDRATEEHQIVIPQNLAGKFISATTMFYYLGLSGAFGPTSEFSKAVQVTADGCPTLAPQILAAVTENGSTTIRWSPLPGATEYRIWVMAPRDEPRIAYRGTDTQVTTSFVAGAEWWIEARFDPCYGTQSEHRFIPGP